MRHLSASTRPRRPWLALLLALSASQSVAGQEPAYGQFADKKRPTRALSLSDVSLEVPSRDWSISRGFGSQLVFAIEKRKGEATVLLGRDELRRELDQSYVDQAYAARDAENLLSREPGARGGQHWLKEIDGRRFVVVTFERDGLSGPERVIIYSFVSGKNVFRLHCSAPGSAFARYAPLFGHMAWSLRPATPVG